MKTITRTTLSLIILSTSLPGCKDKPTAPPEDPEPPPPVVSQTQTGIQITTHVGTTRTINAAHAITPSTMNSEPTSCTSNASCEVDPGSARPSWYAQQRAPLDNPIFKPIRLDSGVWWIGNFKWE